MIEATFDDHPAFRPGATLEEAIEAVEGKDRKTFVDPLGEKKKAVDKASRETKRTKIFRLPEPSPTAAAQKIEIHTLRFGQADWLAVCAPTLDGWCARHGYELRVWGDPGDKYPSPKFVEIEMLEAFLAGDSEWMLYVDADVYVHPGAPAVPAAEPGFHATPDPARDRMEPRWRKWARKYFGREIGGWTYRNAGVWLCDREAARRILAEVSPPFVVGIMEQHQFNLWLRDAAAGGMGIHDLPADWNRFAAELEPAWFHHISGRDKVKKFRALLKERLIPPRPETFRRWESTGPRAVCYLYTAKQAVWDELRYSLRSLAAHLADCPPIHIFCDEIPVWADAEAGGITWHHTPGYPEALAGALQIADEVLLMNDDIWLLRPMEWDDFRVALRRQGNHMRTMRQDLVCRRPYPRGKGRVSLWFYHHGYSRVLKFNTHTPYLFERAKAIETLERFGIWWKIPFEIAYHNLHRTPHRELGGARIYALPAGEDALFLNSRTDGPDAETRRALMEMFPEPSPWEKPNGFEQLLHLPFQLLPDGV